MKSILKTNLLTLCVCLTFLTGCHPKPTPMHIFYPTPTSTRIFTPVPTQSHPITYILPSATPDSPTPLPPERWKEWPVVPVVSAHARKIYLAGRYKGNDPATFSKVGDCQNVPSLFLGTFDNPNDFSLGPSYSYLEPTIAHFAGSFSRKSIAVNGGFNIAAVLNPLMADRYYCDENETPLACEFKVNRPSLVIISMETWWEKSPEDYQVYLKQIVEYSISQGVVPILATKADNVEGNDAINQVIVSVANEYDIPLWNFWLAVQNLPNHGLSEDGFHITRGRNFFDNPVDMQYAWPVRNLTALEAIHAVWINVIKK